MITTRTSSGRVLVTGASRGIGRAVALAIAARGGRVAAVGRDAAALAATAAHAPDRIVPVVTDLLDAEARETVVARAVDALSGLDGVVGAAGIVRYDRAIETTEASMLDQLVTNLVAPVRIAQAAARHFLVERTAGSIVHVSSTLSLRPAPSTLGYGAAKAALDAATRTLALELAPSAIRVNAVLLGVVDTDMVRVPRPGSDLEGEAQLENLCRLHPLGRLGRPDEVAETVLHVLDASWMTGSSVVLDGGLSL